MNLTSRLVNSHCFVAKELDLAILVPQETFWGVEFMAGV